MAEHVAKGRQAYVVYPLVEESEKIDLKDAISEFENLKNKFPSIRFGLLHGKMKGEEKDQVMSEFRKGEIQVLVSTTVIEVGVDVQDVDRLADGVQRIHDRDRDAVVSAQHDELRAPLPHVPNACRDVSRVGVIVAAVEGDVAHVHVRGQVRGQIAADVEIPVRGVVAEALRHRADRGGRPGLVVGERVVAVGLAVANAQERDLGVPAGGIRSHGPVEEGA